jgi:hypothetical protein
MCICVYMYSTHDARGIQTSLAKSNNSRISAQMLYTHAIHENTHCMQCQPCIKQEQGACHVPVRSTNWQGVLRALSLEFRALRPSHRVPETRQTCAHAD